MPARRIISLWFPRLGAERLLRLGAAAPPGAQAPGGEPPFAVIRETGQMQVLAWLSEAASAAGLVAGQPIRDARAMCPALVTRLQNPQAEAEFLTALRRWAGRFSPWVGEQPPAGLLLDITGCAHLFGGEAAMLAQICEAAAALGLSVEAGLADTPGAAWALARYAGAEARSARTGDAVDQEAPATRARAAKRRHWERGGPAPTGGGHRAPSPAPQRIAPPGQTRQAIAGLPAAALRLEPETVTQLARLGLSHIGDLIGMPRAALARRFGQHLVQRLDQALGVTPEPVSPARPPDRFAVRLTLPEPIGLESDLLAGLDRLLPPLCARLRARGRGARRARLQAFRADGTSCVVEVGLARPADDPDRLRPLLAMKLGEVEAGYGIDALRLEAHVTEPLSPVQHRGHLDAAQTAMDRKQAARAGDTALEDLVGRLGARIGLEAITRRHPAESHIPEKAALTLAAAWSDPGPVPWPEPPRPRPLLLWPPEPVLGAGDGPTLPAAFRWRRRALRVAAAEGPERIAPEWWLDDPAWRSGIRDYWRVTVEGGERLWLYYAHGGAASAGWFCQGSFA